MTSLISILIKFSFDLSRHFYLESLPKFYQKVYESNKPLYTLPIDKLNLPLKIWMFGIVNQNYGKSYRELFNFPNKLSKSESSDWTKLINNNVIFNLMKFSTSIYMQKTTAYYFYYFYGHFNLSRHCGKGANSQGIIASPISLLVKILSHHLGIFNKQTRKFVSPINSEQSLIYSKYNYSVESPGFFPGNEAAT